MRAFIAIELPREIKDTLARLQAKLKTAGADVKWVEPNNIHLTLKFLGEITEEAKDQVCLALEKISGSKKPFDIVISSMGAFPNPGSPRVIWAAVAAGDPEIKTIAREIETCLEEIGIAKETREFSSHITLGRTRSAKNRQELSKLLEVQAGKKFEYRFPAAKITLFKSTLTPRGPIYETIKEFPLSK